MSHPRAVLRQPQSYPESRCRRTCSPAPPALGRAVELAFLRWEKRGSRRPKRFWRDFGFHIVSSRRDRLVARAAGTAPCIAIAERAAQPLRRPGVPHVRRHRVGPLRRGLGASWLAARVDTRRRTRRLARPLRAIVWLLQGQSRVEPLPLREPVSPRPTPPRIRPASIGRCARRSSLPASCGSVTSCFRRSTFPAWPSGTWRCSASSRPTCSTSPTEAPTSPSAASISASARGPPHLVLVGGIEEKYEHSAYEVVDLDALGQGQQVLRAHGHGTCGESAAISWAASCSTTGAIPTASSSNTTPMATCSPRNSRPRTRRSSSAASGPGAPTRPASMKPRKDLRNPDARARLLRRKAITPGRLKLLSEALDAPARPWG